MDRSGHIVFVINSLVGGGAERALVNVIAGLETSLRDCRVSLVLLDDLPMKHRVPAFVETHVLSTRGGTVRSLILLARKLRILKPDVVLSFLSRANCANVLAAKLLGHASIISERVHTSSHLSGGVAARIQRRLIRLFYPRADAVIAVSAGVKRDLVENFGVSSPKVVVIHNPIDQVRLKSLAQDADAPTWQKPFVISIGRLVHNKNFAMLFRAFAGSGVSERLVVLGEGPDRGALEQLAAELGIADRVVLPGYVDNPYRAIADASFFVSSSNAEGFPNAMIEAMALGCPVIATDCESGPADVLSPAERPRTDGVTHAAYGLLVPVQRDDILAQAISLYADPDEREAYRERGSTRIESFSPTQSCERYWQAIAALLPTKQCGAPRMAASERGDQTEPVPR